MPAPHRPCGSWPTGRRGAIAGLGGGLRRRRARLDALGALGPAAAGSLGLSRSRAWERYAAADVVVAGDQEVS